MRSATQNKPQHRIDLVSRICRLGMTGKPEQLREESFLDSTSITLHIDSLAEAVREEVRGASPRGALSSKLNSTSAAAATSCMTHTRLNQACEDKCGIASMLDREGLSPWTALIASNNRRATLSAISPSHT